MAIEKARDLRIDISFMEIIEANIKDLTEFVEKKLILDVDYTNTLFQSLAKTREGVKHKPALLDPGCNKLLTLYRVRPDHKVLEYQSVDESGLIRYVVAADLIHYVSGWTVAQGIGSCSTKEKKYRVRMTGQTDRALKNNYGWTEDDIVQYIEGNPDKVVVKGEMRILTVPDQDMLGLDNTILKMAAKRAEMDGCLQLPGVAARFTQDIGVPPPEDDKKTEKPPKPPVKEVPSEVAKSQPSSQDEKEAVEQLIETIQTAHPNLSQDAIVTLMNEERAKAEGLLTEEAALYLIAFRLNKATEGSPNIADSMKVPDAVEAKFAELETALEADEVATLHLVDIEKGNPISVSPKKFMGDLWGPTNAAIIAVGGRWIRDGKQSHWEIKIDA